LAETKKAPAGEVRVDVGGGQTVRVLIDGKEGAPWVVMSHSILADSHIFDPQVEALAGKYRIARIDIRGHGGSDPSPPPYSMDMLVQDVLKVFDHLGIGKAHFIGVSLGGMIGYGLGSAHPERLASLVISGSRADAPETFRTTWDDRIAAVRKDGMKVLAMPTVERWFTPEFLAANPQVRQDVAQTIERTSVQGFEGCARALQALDYVGAVERIKVPTLMIAGSRDATMPDDMRAIHKKIASSRYEVIEGSGHIATLDNAAEFNRLVTQFLEQVG
jgi:3-oxoadipate enol-lactonase